MGLLGRYIDALPETARDCIIRTQDWSAVESAGVMDLLRRAELSGSRWKGWNPARRIAIWKRSLLLGWGARAKLRDRFRRARKRVGTERLIRLIKLRAGRPNRPVLDRSLRRRRDLFRDGG